MAKTQRQQLALQEAQEKARERLRLSRDVWKEEGQTVIGKEKIGWWLFISLLPEIERKDKAKKKEVLRLSSSIIRVLEKSRRCCQ